MRVISGWHDPSETCGGCLCSGSLDISYVVFAGTNAARFGGTFSTVAAAAVTGVPDISGTATQVRRPPHLQVVLWSLLPTCPQQPAASHHPADAGVCLCYRVACR